LSQIRVPAPQTEETDQIFIEVRWEEHIQHPEMYSNAVLLDGIENRGELDYVVTLTAGVTFDDCTPGLLPYRPS